MKTTRLLGAFTAFAFLSAQAVEAVVAEIGKKAPPLKIAHWSKGGPVDLAKGRGKKVYVVEFWATWCAPCVANIPHMSELQKKYAPRGVQFIGISDEKPSRVDRFVKKMGSKMDYAVACDPSRATYKPYIDALKLEGVPHAFIVDKKGDIVWIGHPEIGMEEALEAVLDGSWDAAKSKRMWEGEMYFDKHYNRYIDLLTEGKDAPGARKAGEALVAKIDDLPGLLDTVAWSLLTDDGLKDRHLDLALKAARRAYEGSQAKDTGIMDTYARALYDNGKWDQAIEIQKRAVRLADEGDREDLQATLKRYISGK